MLVQMSLSDKLFDEESVKNAAAGTNDVAATHHTIKGQNGWYHIYIDSIPEDNDIDEVTIEFWSGDGPDRHIWRLNLETKELIVGCIDGGYCNEHERLEIENR